ncbi:MAG TPA: hypothetical protein PLY19_05165 [Rhodoglobus sp.]|nr:hypothetical protein [Rhodoglobus sp.]
MTTTRVQAEALATFVRLIRKDWDHPGIVAAIGRCKREPLSEVAVALIRLAENGQAKTPALLPEPGRHWKRAALDDTPAGPNTRNLDLCPDHGNPRRDCLDCHRDAGPELTPEQIAANAAAMRAQVREMQRQVREGNAERRRLQGAQP